MVVVGGASVTDPKLLPATLSVRVPQMGSPQSTEANVQSSRIIDRSKKNFPPPKSPDRKVLAEFGSSIVRCATPVGTLWP